MDGEIGNVACRVVMEIACLPLRHLHEQQSSASWYAAADAFLLMMLILNATGHASHPLMQPLLFHAQVMNILAAICYM